MVNEHEAYTEMKLASVSWARNLKATPKVISLQKCKGFQTTDYDYSNWFIYNPTLFHNNFRKPVDVYLFLQEHIL